KFYTPMIEPLTKFKLRGFLWYQGETNCFLDEKISYAYKMKALITSWRSVWGGKETMPLQETFWGATFGMLTDKFGVHWMINCEK
ncbi:MAG: hypothetical protein EOP53_10310, partial [Sphingobacteriales bacterium]